MIKLARELSRTHRVLETGYSSKIGGLHKIVAKTWRAKIIQRGTLERIATTHNVVIRSSKDGITAEHKQLNFKIVVPAVGKELHVFCKDENLTETQRNKIVKVVKSLLA